MQPFMNDMSLSSNNMGYFYDDEPHDTGRGCLVYSVILIFAVILIIYLTT